MGGTVCLQSHLRHLTSSLFKALGELHVASSAARRLLSIPSACPKSPIFAVQLQQPRDLAQYLQKQGMMVRAVVPPTVPRGTERVRICLHAGNTIEEVESLVQALKKWCERRSSGAEDELGSLEQRRPRL